MKNFEKYIDDIIKDCESGDYLECALAHVRGKKRGSCGIPCKACTMDSLKWMNKEYVEPIKLSHDEYVILKNVSKNYEYITRDKYHYGLLGLHEDKPERCPTIWFSSENTSFDCYKHLFQFIKWEDQPYEIERLITDYEKENQDAMV